VADMQLMEYQLAKFKASWCWLDWKQSVYFLNHSASRTVHTVYLWSLMFKSMLVESK